jgi:hypothetical protein
MRKDVWCEGRGFKCSLTIDNINSLQVTEVLEKPLDFSLQSGEWEGMKRWAMSIQRQG